MPSRSKSAILGTVAIGVAVAFLCFFEVSLHCTQHTSFAIAIFEMTPHVEERARDASVFYDHPLAIPARALLGGLVAGFLIVPGAATLVALHRFITRKQLAVVGISLWIPLAVAGFTPHMLAERAHALVLFTGALGIPLYGLALVALASHPAYAPRLDHNEISNRDPDRTV